jgi:hypothetical protein
MCCNTNLFYVLHFKILCNYFLKFIVHNINSEMVILIERDKTNVVDVDVTVS